MKKTIVYIFATLLLLTGCADTGVPTYSDNSYDEIKTVETGVVIERRGVAIEDGGGGKFLGAIIGAVLGSTIGSNSGKTLAVLGGTLAGGYVGSEVGRENASELTVKLDSGKTVVVVAKVLDIVAGERVRIIKDGNKVAQVVEIK